MNPYTLGAILLGGIALAMPVVVQVMKYIERRKEQARATNYLRWCYLRALQRKMDRQPDDDPVIRALYSEHPRRVQ